jgi:signal transduction histidine kinase
MDNRRGLRQRLGRAFLLQAVLISIAAIIGVYAAAFAIEEVLVKRALKEEATYFWDHYDRKADFPLPDTRNLTGYLAPQNDAGGLPEPLQALPTGFHKLPTQVDFSVVYVTEHGSDRLYLVFDGESVGQLALYFGLVPLAGILIVLYLIAWLAYRLAGRAISPIVWLAKEVQKFDPDSDTRPSFSPSSLPGNPDREVLALSEALSTLTRRVDEFVERERNFTRDASHELRSPLTVIKIAADMLLSEQELDRHARNSVLRIRRSATDMEELTEAFLLLAREADHKLSAEPACINEIVEYELDRARYLLDDKPVTVAFDAEYLLLTPASEKVLSVLIGNLIRNAFSYTDEGTVRIHISDRALTIEDSGVGMPSQEVEQVFKPFFRGGSKARGGHGVGLTIVKRLSDRFGWPIRLESTVGVGTRVVVDFPGATCTDLETDDGIPSPVDQGAT